MKITKYFHVIKELYRDHSDLVNIRWIYNLCLRFALRTCTLVFQTRYSKWTNSSNSWALVLSKHIAAKTHWRAANSGNSHVRGEEKEQKRISDFYRCFCDRNGSVAKSRPRLRQPAVRMVDITSAFSIVISLGTLDSSKESYIVSLIPHRTKT